MFKRNIYLLFGVLIALFLSGCSSQDFRPIQPLQPPLEEPEEPLVDGFPIIEIGDDPNPDRPGRIYLDRRSKVKLTPPLIGGIPPGPKIYGEIIDYDNKTFRFATWNVHLLSNTTATANSHKVKLKPLGHANEVTYTKKDAIFKILKYNGVHIAALQEIMGNQFAGTPLKKTEHGYDVILGTEIKPGQYCAIVAIPEFKCKHHRTEVTSRTNWAKCKIPNSPTGHQTVYAGCSHFDTDSLPLASNVTVFFDQLNKIKTPPSSYYRPRVPGAGRGGDNLIFGVDANSSPYNPLANPWKDHDSKWAGKPVPPATSVPLTKLHLPKLQDYNKTSTKFDKQGDRPNQKPWYSTNPHQRNIDFIGHRLKKPEIEYIEDSMAALNVELMHMGQNGKTFWLNFYNASDHIPVKADYRVH